LLALTGLVALAAGGLGSSPGWQGVGLLVLFLGGTQLLSVAILGEYVSRIAQDVNGRPLYVIRRRIGLGSPHDVSPHGRPRKRRRNLQGDSRT
jgi:hypothetical protein